MDELPVELILYLGPFLDQASLASLVLASRKYHVLLTSCLYDSAIEYMNPTEALSRARYSYMEDYQDLFPEPGFGYKWEVFGCARHWHSEEIMKYWSRKPLDVVMYPAIDFDWDRNPGRTLLHEAVGGDNVALTRLLLDRGADINAISFLAETPLHRAIQSSNHRMVKLLLEYGADRMIDAANLLWMAIMYSDQEVFRLVFAAFRDAGGEVGAVRKGETALHRALYHRKQYAVEALLRNGANPLVEDYEGRTALHHACLYVSGCIDPVIEQMEAQGCVDFDKPDDGGATPLHLAIINDHWHAARLVILRGADIHRTFGEKTPLERAIADKRAGCIRMFLKHHPELWTTDRLLGQLGRATRSMDSEAVALLTGYIKKRQIQLDPMSSYFKPVQALTRMATTDLKYFERCLPAIAELIDTWGNVHGQDKHRRNTPIHTFFNASAPGPHPEAYFSLLEALFDGFFDRTLQNCEGNTVLHLAVTKGGVRVADMLLRFRGRNQVNVKNKKGDTPLHLAIGAWDSERIIKALITAGADVNAPGRSGRTPLHLAAARGQDIDSLKVLLSAGADVSALCREGNPPVHFAAEIGWDEAVGALVEAGAEPHEGCSNCARRMAVWGLSDEEKERALEELSEELDDPGLIAVFL
ncbi:ankyrin repeat domain-containing protein [Aspergillus lucknowensis]|uniref:Ankyrin repeat-containing domain protein n=1 Tax=Aspergillus lucknowensis TaxID=176173 RepID=A0ABR4LN08_9EURO